MAKLQDQSERTEAYSRANEVKRQYEQQKVQYETALQHADANGNYKYIDPMDNNPDVSKRAVREGNVAQAYQDLRSLYEEGRSSIKGIAREDIASDLLHQYVGDDLIRTQIRSNKHMIKVKSQKLMDDSIRNIELNFNSVLEKVEDNASPDTVQLEIMKIENAMNREIGMVSPVVGSQGTQALQQYKDKMYAKFSKDVLASGVSQSSVDAAELMISKIKDPADRAFAGRDFERRKKAVIAQNERLMINGTRDAMAMVQSSAVIDDQTTMKMMGMAAQLKNMYIDPENSIYSREQVDAMAADMVATVSAKTIVQNNIGTDMTFLLDEPEEGRSPAAEGEGSEQLREQMIDEVQHQLERTGMSVENLDIRSLAESKLRAAYTSVKDNLNEIVQHQNPGLSGRALYDKITQAASAQGLGDVPLVSQKQGSEFRKSFKEAMGRNYVDGFSMFNEQIAKAGASFEGEESYTRKLAIDLVGKDESVSYLISAADATPAMRERILENAALFNNKASDFGLTEGKLGKRLNENNVLTGLGSIAGTSFYRGLKQSVMHEAARIYMENNNMSSPSDGAIDDAIDQAVSNMSSLYTIVQDGDTAVVAINHEGGVNYSENRAPLEKGIEAYKKLEGFDLSRKHEIIDKYISPELLARNQKTGEVTTPKEDVDFFLKEHVTLRSSANWPNMNTVYVKGRPLFNENNEIVRVPTSGLLDMGQEKERQEVRRRAITSGIRTSPYGLMR